MRIILHSGGIDSSVLLGIDQIEKTIALFVNWGQPSIYQEERSSIEVCRKLNIKRKSISIPYLHPGPMNIGIGTIGPRVVRGRNLIFISAAASIPDASEIWLGACEDDQDDYPDCGLDFIDSCDRLLSGTYGIRVRAPLIEKKKDEILKMGCSLGILDLCWSCYQPTIMGDPCSRCNSCASKIAAGYKLSN